MSNELSNKTVTYLLGEISCMLENMQNSLRAEITETRDSLQSSLRAEIAETRDSLQSQLTQINLTLEQNVVPRLNTIESCYVSTYERYSQGINQLESIQSDILVMKDVIMKHSTQLAKIS